MPRGLSETTLKVLEYHHAGKSSSFIENEVNVTQQAVSAAIKRHYDKVLSGQISFNNTTQTTQHKQHNTKTTQHNEKVRSRIEPSEKSLVDVIEQHNTNNTTLTTQHNNIPGSEDPDQNLSEEIDPLCKECLRNFESRCKSNQAEYPNSYSCTAFRTEIFSLDDGPSVLTVNSLCEQVIAFCDGKQQKAYTRTKMILITHDKNRNYQSNILRDMIEILIEMRRIR